MRVVVAIGGNLGKPQETAERALKLIEAEVGPIHARSKWIETEPLLHPETPVEGQPNYLNGAVLVESELPPFIIMQKLLEIETLLGRERKGELRWGPRVIDLDLICCDDLVLRSPALKLPHPEMHKRNFVLEPMAEICPDWRHPLLGFTVLEMLALLPD